MNSITKPNTSVRHTEHVDFRIATIAGQQRGVISYMQLRHCGLSKGAICRRAIQGRLHRIHPGVYAVGHASLEFEARVSAAILWSGCGVACGRTTAKLLGFYDRGRESIEILSPGRHRPQDHVVVRFSRSIPARDITQVRGTATTTAARAVAELSEDLTKYQLANAIHEMRRLRLARRSDIARIVDEHPFRRGHPVMVGALELFDAGSSGTMSGAEDRALRLLLRAGFPTPLVNVRMRMGRRQGRVDLRWPELGLCVEIDGPEHDLPRQRRIDEERDKALRAMGMHVIRIPVAFIDGIVDILAPYFSSVRSPNRPPAA